MHWLVEPATNARFKQTGRLLLSVRPATSQALGTRCPDRREFRQALCTLFDGTTGHGAGGAIEAWQRKNSRELTRMETFASAL